jgi:hypothetical protein
MISRKNAATVALGCGMGQRRGRHCGHAIRRSMGSAYANRCGEPSAHAALIAQLQAQLAKDSPPAR